MSYKVMEEILGKSRPTLNRAIKILKEDKWLQVVKIGTANAYVLNSAVFWQDNANKRKTARFTAQVITGLDEQDKDLRKNPTMKLKRTPFLAQNERLSVDVSKQLPPPDQQEIDLT